MELKVNNTEKAKASIEVVDHLTFEGNMKTNFISSIDMAEIISSLFAPAFFDYYGCKVHINDGRNPIVAHTMPAGALYVDLIFKDQGASPEGSKAWKNIIARGSKDSENSDLASRYMRVNGSNNGRAYEVTKKTYEALEEFTVNGQRTRWAELTQEISTSMSIYGKEEVVVCVTGLDLNKIITKLYGDKTQDGRYEYAVQPSTIIPSKTQEFVMQVSQLDLSTVRELQKTLGIFTANAPQFHQYHR